MKQVTAGFHVIVSERLQFSVLLLFMNVARTDPNDSFVEARIKHIKAIDVLFSTAAACGFPVALRMENSQHPGCDEPRAVRRPRAKILLITELLDTAILQVVKNGAAIRI